MSVAFVVQTEMPEKMRVRFGKIELPEDQLPSPQELHDSINDSWTVRATKQVVQGEDPVPLEHKGMNPYYSDSHGDHSFCKFTYISDKEDSATVRDGDDLKVAPDQQPVRPTVFYFKNGQFAYEPQRGLIKHWIPQFIMDRTGVETDPDVYYESFSQDTMRDFYEERDEITVFRFGSTGDEDFDSDSSIARALNELATEVDSQEFSGGDPPTNLKGLEIFEEAKEKMFVSKLKGSKGDGYTNEILSSGMYQPKWSEDDWEVSSSDERDLEQRRAETIYRRIAPYLRRLE